MKEKMRDIAIFFVALLYSPILLLIKKIEGLDDLPRNQAFVFISNHVSRLDGLVLFLLLYFKRGIKIHILASDHLYKNPFFAFNLKLIRCIRIKEDNKKEVIIQSIKMLKRGQSILVFPEGGLIRNVQGKKPKTGFVRIASKSNKEIVPIRLIYSKNKVFSRMFPIYKRLSIKIGKPINLKRRLFSDYNSVRTESNQIINDLYSI